MARRGRNVATATANVMVNIDANAASAKNEVNGLVKSLKGIKLGKDLDREFADLVKDFNSALAKLKAQAAQGIESPADKKQLAKDYREVEKILAKIRGVVGGITDTPLLNLIDDSEVKKMKEAKAALDDYWKAKKSYEKNQKKRANLESKYEDAKKEYYGNKDKKVIAQDEYNKMSKAESNARGQATKTRNKYNKALGDFNPDVTTKESAEEIERLKKKMEEAADNAEKLKSELDQFIGADKIAKLKEEFERLGSELENLGKDPLASFKERLSKIGFGDLVDKDIKEIKQIIENISPAALDKVSQVLEEISKRTDSVTDETKTMGNALEESFSKYDKAYEHQQDIDMLTGQIRQFFTYSNGIQIFKEAVRDAISTVKELDAAMTETAVVTDYSISDMWSQLPEYTKKANELGATTKGVYETMTLYYQQGGVKI